MIKISKLKTKVNCEVKELAFKDLHKFIQQNDWTPFIYNKNYRKQENFISTDMLVADIDDKLSIDEALGRLHSQGLAYSLTFSKNHQKEKHGVVCPRYRIVLPLDNPIFSADKYTLAWRKLESMFPEMDAACKDKARFYYSTVGKDEEYPNGLINEDGICFNTSDLDNYIPATNFNKSFLTIEQIKEYCETEGIRVAENQFLSDKSDRVIIHCKNTDKHFNGDVTPSAVIFTNGNYYCSGCGHKENLLNKHNLEIPVSFWTELENNENLNKLFNYPEDKEKDIVSLANVLYLQNHTEKEVLAVVANTTKGKEEGIKYSEDLVSEIFHNPPKVDDPNYDYYLGIANSQLIRKRKQELIFEYKLNKEHERTLKLIESDKRKGIYSLLNTAELRKDKYLSDISAMRDAIAARLFCITEELTPLVPLFGVELILMAAETGRGKTSSLVNIVEPLIAQNKKILCISNEERGSDIAMRIAALKLGYNINNRGIWDSNSDEWINLTRECAELTNNENLHIVDNYVPGRDLKTGETVDPLDLTNVDHIKALLTSVERDGFKFDLMLFDYITKVGNSDAKDATHKVIVDTIKYIEEWAKRNGCPCIIFSQLKPQPKEGKPLEYADRLPASRQMLHAFSTALEIETNYDLKETKIISRKVRYGEQFTKTLVFDRGRYISELDKKEVKC